MKRILPVTLFVTVLIACVSCGGGGGGPKPPPVPPPPANLSITSINLAPAEVSTGTVVELSATYNNANLAASCDKTWEVSAGALSLEQPDFGLILRQTAGIKSPTAVLTTKASRIYWFTPSAAGACTVKLTVGTASKSKSVSVSSSPLTLEVLPGAEDSTVVKVNAQNATDLYQAAFRISFDSARYRPVSVTPGSFLGGQGDVLFLGLTNQSGFVPVGITRKGDAPGVSGSGTLAQVVFAPKSASHVPSSLGLAGFDLTFYLLRDGRGLPLAASDE